MSDIQFMEAPLRSEKSQLARARVEYEQAIRTHEGYSHMKTLAIMNGTVTYGKEVIWRERLFGGIRW